MKKLTWGLITLLAWELIAISQKDKKFKTTFKKKKGADKRNYVFTTLFNFNKKIIEDTTKEIKKFDAETTLDDLKLQAEDQFNHLKEKVSSLEEKIENTIEDFSQEDLKEYIAEIKEYYLSTKETIKTITGDMNEKYALEEKLVAIKKNIDTIRTSIKK